MTMIQVAACSNKVVHVQEALYHYVKLNAGAYSNTISEKHLTDIRFNMDRTVAFLQDKYGDSLDKDIAYFKLSNKLPYLISDDEAQYKIWKEWYPEANKYVLSNKETPLRIRLLQWAASKNMFWLVKLHYKFIYKFVYGVMYR